ncbi:MAG: 5-formyltetrahydrofolate cyclo-ligase, partial [Bacteroidales bacterium]|nr:5-formyltetrahydrofolate cyclo-ligase [Bacteroidales bacterium]
ELKKFESLNDLQKGEQFGINEPVGENYDSPEKIDLIIIPGVAFDSENNRLGRGKAYYDKLLKQTKAFKLGICFDFQMVDKVPTDKYDIKMDRVVSD